MPEASLESAPERTNLPCSPSVRSEILFSNGLAFSERLDGLEGAMTVTSKPMTERRVDFLRRADLAWLMIICQSKGRLLEASLTCPLFSWSTLSAERQYWAVGQILFMTYSVVSRIELLQRVFLKSPQVKKWSPWMSTRVPQKHVGRDSSG